ncbi:hypothetical protein KAI04_04560 [Candidatus Pacearchaeota archaeon]|nr:hypothetical protein [Candidatus Pacearchaeota archaeon]
MNNKILITLMFVLLASMTFVLAANGEQDVIPLGTEDQVQERVQVQDGSHLGENGQMFQVQMQTNNRFQLESEGVSVECECEMTQEKTESKTQLFTKMSNGVEAEIKVMPNTASETALERLKLQTCSEENECQIELKEVGAGDKAQMAYELQTQREAKVLGLFKTQLRVTAQIDAETGEVIKVRKQWWAFLASEPAEE